KWIGYIQEAELPTGTVSMICDGKNDLVFDMAGNSQTLVKNNLTVDSSESGVYGNWDISKPTFATLRANFQEEWQENTYFEAIGNNFGAGSTLDRIEFHFFDNTPNYNTTDPAVWVTEHGWVVNDFTKEQLVLPDSYCADNFGGSRPFHAQKEFRTTGGLRFSSVQNISQSFLYTTNDTEEPSISFNNSMQTVIGANAKIFTGSSSTRRPTNNYDGLYISLMLQDTSLNVKTTFLVSYNNQNSYITDLAGNRLLSKTIHTIDRTSPSIGIILSPISQKDFYIVFVKKINQNTVKLVDNEENKIEIPETFLELLPQCFEIIKIQKDGTYTLSDIQIDTSVYATEIQLNDSENFTAFKMTLNRDVTFEDIKSLHFKIKNPQKYDFLMTDPVTNIKDSYVTLIQDKLGNYIDINQCHAFSDVAINSVVPLYAYNSALNEVIEEDGKKKVNIFDGLYNEEHFAVRDWNKDQQNYGTLFSQQEISIVADFDSISKENALKNKLKIYLSNSPDEE
ncbi:MAG: hypothetical protein IJ937_05040, partial [Treponema sp.]|nr:hypothetical protein [Treponema sp.]